MSAAAAGGIASCLPRSVLENRMAVLDRAACLLHTRGGRGIVEFSYWLAESKTDFCAQLDWARNEVAPRVMVADRRTGFSVCQSLPGKPFDLDTASIGQDVAEDEDDFKAWQAKQVRRGRA